MNQLTTPVSVMQAIDIACSIAKASDFMRDAPQWLPWALREVKSVQPLPFGQWLVKTATGLAKLRPCYDAARSVVGYEVMSATTAAWYVPVHMVATPTGCQLAITFTKPDSFSQLTFDAGVQYTTEGLHTLKLALEQD